MRLSLHVTTVRHVSLSAPTSAVATVQQQGAFSAPPSLAMSSHKKKTIDYLTSFHTAPSGAQRVSLITDTQIIEHTDKGWGGEDV